MFSSDRLSDISEAGNLTVSAIYLSSHNNPLNDLHALSGAYLDLPYPEVRRIWPSNISLFMAWRTHSRHSDRATSAVIEADNSTATSTTMS